jgi:hypothetical protein
MARSPEPRRGKPDEAEEEAGLMNTGRAVPGFVAVVLAVLVVGCGGGARGGSDQPGVQLPPSAAPGPAGAAARTSIAESSVQDLAATLRANNVDDPERWARVIAQSRPYPADDPNLGKLRQVLAQNQADPPTIDRITNALTP